jgi:hypothetical protein
MVSCNGTHLIPLHEVLKVENSKSLAPLIHSDQMLLHHPQIDLHLPEKAPAHYSRQVIMSYIIYTVSYNSTTHTTCLLTFMMYKYSEL